MMAYALDGANGVLGPNSILIIVNLDGGCSYNIAPVYNGAYRDRFPTISYGPENSLSLNSSQGLHPSLSGLKSLYDQGDLALYNKVGLGSMPDFGHDTAGSRWKTGRSSASTNPLVEQAVSGWMARMTAEIGQQFAGISLAGGDELTRGLGTTPIEMVALGQSLESFNFLQSRGEAAAAQWYAKALEGSIVSSRPRSSAQAIVASKIEEVEAVAATLRTQVATVTLPNVQFPGSGFGQRCQDAAKIIAASQLGTRVIYLRQGGYDSHANERIVLPNLLNDLNAGLSALVDCVKALGRWNDLIIVSMSEFGRTFENNSQGSDHGWGGVMFLLGGRILGGQRNAPPGAQELTGSYINSIDLDPRQIYAGIVQAMGFDVNRIFPDQFPNYDIASNIFKA